MVDFDKHLRERFTQADRLALCRPAGNAGLELETPHGDVVRMASLEQLGRVKVCLRCCVDVGHAARVGLSGDASPRHAQVD